MTFSVMMELADAKREFEKYENAINDLETKGYGIVIPNIEDLKLEDPQKLWESNIFGKSLFEMVNDGLHTKLMHLSDDSREKLSETLSRIVNESSNGLICILL